VFVCILSGKAVPEMTYTVSGGTLNPTHSLTHLSLRYFWRSGCFSRKVEPSPNLFSQFKHCIAWKGHSRNNHQHNTVKPYSLTAL